MKLFVEVSLFYLYDKIQTADVTKKPNKTVGSTGWLLLFISLMQCK